LSGVPQGAGGVGGLLAMTVYTGANVGTYDYAYDGNGNVAALLNAASGGMAGQWEYGPFGEVIKSAGLIAKVNPFRFSTKYQDDETSLCYYGYRYYDPSSGKWLNRDSLEERWGANIYGFAWNCTPNFIDTDGRQLLQVDAFIDTAVEIAPRISVAGDGATTTASSGGPGTIVDLGPPSVGPVGPGILPPVPMTVPQNLPQPQPQPQPQPPDTKPKPRPNNTPKNPDVLYRAMQNWGGSPGVGESARLLGVRPNPPFNQNYDVLLDDNGNVSDFDKVNRTTQGMSVAPTTPLNLPPHRLTKIAGLINWQGKPGEGRDPVWEISRFSIAGKLVYIEDNPGRGLEPVHGVIAPAYCMKYEDYKQAIENTRPLWKLTNLAPYVTAP
jgi:RHS repeat-associated protein